MFRALLILLLLSSTAAVGCPIDEKVATSALDELPESITGSIIVRIAVLHTRGSNGVAKVLEVLQGDVSQRLVRISFSDPSGCAMAPRKGEIGIFAGDVDRSGVLKLTQWAAASE